jgi:hypothetical protein
MNQRLLSSWLCIHEDNDEHHDFKQQERKDYRMNNTNNKSIKKGE